MDSINMIDVVTIINDVYWSGPGLSPRAATLKTKYPEFINEYPLLYQMIIKPRFNIELFNDIIAMKRNTEKKRKKNRDCDIENIPEIKAMFERQLTKVDYIN